MENVSTWNNTRCGRLNYPTQCCQVPVLPLFQCQSQRSYFCIVHSVLSQGLVWKWQDSGTLLQKGKGLVGVLRDRNAACPATVTSSSLLCAVNTEMEFK